MYKCHDCGKIWHPDSVHYVCPECSIDPNSSLPPKGILTAIYDYDALQGISFSKLASAGFLQLLPISHLRLLPPLRVGQTPLYQFPSLKEGGSHHQLLVKDDSQNPTFSFKDRASALVSAYAREKGFGTLVAASTGNAGSSLAGICASQQQKAVVFVPAAAPLAKLTQILMYGATLVPVDGNYDTAFELSIASTRQFGWYNRNTAYNPLTVEGKKTAALEIFAQTAGDLPKYIFVPTGDGVIISGLYKGFEDLMYLGLLREMPVLVAVQSSGSANLVDNVFSARFHSKPSHTIADSISVDVPRNFYMAARYINQYKGLAIQVDDDEILEASRLLASRSGIFTEPASAAAFAGYRQFRRQYPDNQQSHLVLLTGSGLKDLRSVQPVIQMPDPVSPRLEDIQGYLEKSGIL